MDLVPYGEEALLELIPEQQFEEYKKVHEEMEEWLFRNNKTMQEKDYEHRVANLTSTAFTEMSIVKAEKLQQFVTHSVSELVGNEVLLTQAARQKFASDLQKILFTEVSYDAFQMIKIPNTIGGCRTTEMFLLRQKKLDDGKVAILFSYFGTKRQLCNNWQYCVANHDEKKIKKWLGYKLFENIMAKMRSLVPRPQSAYRKMLM